MAQVQNPRRSTSGRGAGTSSTYSVQHTRNLPEVHRIPSDCGRGAEDESSTTGDAPIDTGTSPKIPSYNRALIASEGGVQTESYIPSELATLALQLMIRFGLDSCFNPDPRSPRHMINRGKTCSERDAHNAMRFTPQKPACYPNQKSGLTKPTGGTSSSTSQADGRSATRQST